MQCLKGKSVYKGIAMGKISVLKKDDYIVKRTKIEDPQAEIQRVKSAVAASQEQLQKESLNYIRLMSHLYYMAVRAKTGEAVNVDLNDFVKNKYPKALKIAEQICGNMETALQKKLLPEETG